MRKNAKQVVLGQMNRSRSARARMTWGRMTWGRLALAAVVVASLGTSGCFSRQLLGFQTHPDKDVMLMETFESHDYFFWSSHEHVYWSCNESGQALQCTRRCGGDTDLVCPEAAIFAYGAGTNVR